jgi:hypothetical protein
MMSVTKGVLLLIAAYLAAVGLAQICVTIGKWLSAASTLEHCWLLVVATPGDHEMEMRLRQAWSQAVNTPAMDGVRMAVVDGGADEETIGICRCFCREKGVPLVEPGEAGELLRRR